MVSGCCQVEASGIVETPVTTKIVLVLEYDGTNYCGSQLQKNASTVQGEIEKALYKLTGEIIRAKAASRTDTGVHARGQVFTFRTPSDLPLKAFVDGMNHHLPQDIAVKAAFNADDSFDARRGATSREYKYFILNSATRSPIRQGFSYRVPGTLDINAMKEACQALVGRHDFASFITAPLPANKTTIRNVYKAGIEQDEDLIIFGIIANSFLPHQVRNIVGSLIKVGQGKMTVEEFYGLIEAKTPGLASPTAPSCGLCLMRVNYPIPLTGDVK
jgi:tRNA pseudouridine38-40 synthase